MNLLSAESMPLGRSAGVRHLVFVWFALFGLGAHAQAPGCDPNDACCSQCELSVCQGCCPNNVPFQDFDDQSTTTAAWLADLQAEGCGELFFGMWGLVEGGCANSSTHFLFRRTPLTGEARFFDTAGDFLGLTTFSDVVHPVCGVGAFGYYPSPRVCDAPTVTEIHCAAWWDPSEGGTGLSVGDPISLPSIIAGLAVPGLPPPLLVLPVVAVAWLGARAQSSRRR